MPLLLTDHEPLSERQGFVIFMSAKKLQSVFVTREALEDVEFPPLCSRYRLEKHLDRFRAIASEKYERGAIEGDGRIWITSADIIRWRNF